MSKQILKQVSRLESVERRWLGSVFTSALLSGLIFTLLVGQLDLGNILGGNHTHISGTQYLILMAASAIILVTSLAAIVDYFAFELHVERQVVITKKRRRPSNTEDEAEDET